MPVPGANNAYRWTGQSGSIFQNGADWASETPGAPPFAPGTSSEADFGGTGYVTGLGNVFEFNASGTIGLGFVFTGYFAAVQADFAGTDWLTGGTTLTVGSYVRIGHNTDTQPASVAVLAGSVLAERAGGQGLGIFNGGALGVSGTGALVNMGQNNIMLGSQGSGRLTVSAGGSVLAGYLNAGDPTGGAAVQVSGSGSTIRLSSPNSGGFASIGAAGGSGLLSVSGFGVFTCSDLAAGSFAPQGGVGAVDVVLAQLSVGRQLQVAPGSYLDASFGALVTAGTLSVAGTLTEAGQNTFVDVGSLGVSGVYLLELGSDLSINSAISGNGLSINATSGGPAMLTVDAATMYGVPTSIGGSYGTLGSGTLAVQDGGSATLTSLSLNSAVASAPSAIVVTGAFSSLSIGGGVYVGNWGAGTVSVAAGGRLTVGANSALSSIDIYHGAFNAGAGAQVTMAGQLKIESGDSFTASGATLALGGLAILGGTGTVSAGTTLVSDTTAAPGNYALLLNSSAAGAGQLSISGSATVLNTIGPAYVESSTLTVSSGATFTCGAAGTNPNALILNPPLTGAPASVVDVTGAGSRLGVTGNLISYYSAGETLSVTNGATAMVSGDVIDARLVIAVDGGGSALSVGGALSPFSEDPLGGTTLSVTGGASATIGAGSHIVQLTMAGSLSAAGNLEVDAASGYGTISTAGTLQGGGIIQASGGTLVLNGASLGGVLATGGGSTLVLAGLGADVSAIEFLAGGGTLVEANTAKLASISNFRVGDFIDLTGIHNVTDSFAGGTLTLLNSQHSAVGALVFGNSYTAANFTLAGDGHGGTKIGFHA